MPNEWIAYLVLILLLVIFLLPNIKHVKHDEQLVVERLGSFLKVIDQPGWYMLVPLFDRVIERESMLTQKRIITSEKMKIEYTYHITDIKMYCYFALDPVKDLESFLASAWVDETVDLQKIKEMIKDRGIALINIKEITKNNL